MRFERYPRTVLRPITGRRLSAARRALQRQADEYPFSVVEKAGVRISFRSWLGRDRTIAFSWT